MEENSTDVRAVPEYEKRSLHVLGLKGCERAGRPRSSGTLGGTR